MKYVRQPDGKFHIDMGHGEVYKTHITPIDSTNKTTWAHTLIEATKDVLREGFGPYAEFDNAKDDGGLHGWLCDTHGGDVPWNDKAMEELYNEFVKHPEFVSTMEAFEAKFGDCHFPVTYELYQIACEGG